MLINGKHYLSVNEQTTDLLNLSVQIIDQRLLPFKLSFVTLSSVDDIIKAISDMQVRGAPLIGIIAAWGVVFACRDEYISSLKFKKLDDDSYQQRIAVRAERVASARPTAVNAKYCVDLVLSETERAETPQEKTIAALERTRELMKEDLEICKNIGIHGLEIIRSIAEKKRGNTVNILTHCNAGWLATSDYGTATSPIYMAKEEGIDLHVWVDETRPRNQGGRLTVWELSENGVRNSLICDNTGGLLMSQGQVDLVLVGSDRTTLRGDVVNKIGTYLKALAAKDNEIPFYVALPSSTIDWTGSTDLEKIAIEKRSDDEVKFCEGVYGSQQIKILVTSASAQVYNPGFDITPSRLITGLITERGVCNPDLKGLSSLFPDKMGSV